MNLPALLHPYIEDLSDHQLAQVSTYLDLLLRWNAKTNLTSIRNPEQIVTRHFGESFLLARTLFDLSFRAQRNISPPSPLVTTSGCDGTLGAPSFASFGKDGMPNDYVALEPSGHVVPQSPDHQIPRSPDLVDIGSGAGFPGIPLKIAYPEVTMTLIEAHHTKAVFLREVLRALKLDAEVKNVRAESLPPNSADVVTLRAVEKFDSILPTAARLVRTKSAMWERAPSPVQGMRSIPELSDVMNPTQPGTADKKKAVEVARPRATQPIGPDDVNRTPSLTPNPQPQSPIPNPLSPIPQGSVHRPLSTVRGLALLIGAAQVSRAKEILPAWHFHSEIPIPSTQNRVILLAEPD